MAEIQPLVAGNWKMNGLASALGELERLAEGLAALASPPRTDIMICPPVTVLSEAVTRVGSAPILIGGQDCHAAASGAHTGDVSAEMLKDAGAHAVIVGHSERRADHGETDAIVREKAEAAWRAGLVAIICVGETEAERKSGATLDVISRQIAGSVPQSARSATTIVAYEPVWAIGTGLTPTSDDVAEVHAALRAQLREILAAGEGDAVRLLYGGSVKPANAGELMAVPDVNGALVGGASLKADDFLGIINAYI